MDDEAKYFAELADERARHEYLLKVRKGVGIRVARDDLPTELFLVRNWNDFMALVAASVSKVGPLLERDILWIVLGFGVVTDDGRVRVYLSPGQGPEPTLLKHRRAALAKYKGISVRTLMRHEGRAFIELSDTMDTEVRRRNPFALLDEMTTNLERLKEVVELTSVLPRNLVTDIEEALEAATSHLHQEGTEEGSNV